MQRSPWPCALGTSWCIFQFRSCSVVTRNGSFDYRSRTSCGLPKKQSNISFTYIPVRGESVCRTVCSESMTDTSPTVFFGRAKLVFFLCASPAHHRAATAAVQLWSSCLVVTCFSPALTASLSSPPLLVWMCAFAMGQTHRPELFDTSDHGFAMSESLRRACNPCPLFHADGCWACAADKPDLTSPKWTQLPHYY